MSGVLWLLLSLSGLFVAKALIAMFWAIKNGQFDDMEGPAVRILMDEDDPLLPQNRRVLNQKSEADLGLKKTEGSDKIINGKDG